MHARGGPPSPAIGNSPSHDNQPGHPASFQQEQRVDRGTAPTGIDELGNPTKPTIGQRCHITGARLLGLRPPLLSRQRTPTALAIFLEFTTRGTNHLFFMFLICFLICCPFSCPFLFFIVYTTVPRRSGYYNTNGSRGFANKTWPKRSDGDMGEWRLSGIFMFSFLFCRKQKPVRWARREI
jgi:hypothetical protein